MDLILNVANIVFNPFVNDSRVLKESLSLAKSGYKVEVVAHGDEGLHKRDNIKEVHILRLNFLNRRKTTSKIKKLKIYLAWMLEVVGYVKNFDILHCNDLDTLPVGVVVKKFFNKDVKIVYDAHEYETEMDRLKGVRKSLAKFLEKNLIKYADKIITVSDAIAEEYVKLYGIEKPALVLNTPPYKEIEKKDIFRETFGISKEKRIFLYQGGLSTGRGIEILLEAFKLLDDKNSVIVFMGYGPLEELVQKSALEYDNIYFHKAVSPDVLLEYTCSADFGISTIEDSCLSYRYCLPNKMFEYVMAELPVIVSNLPEMKRVVQDNHIGVVAKQNSPQGLREAIEKAVKLDTDKLRENLKKVKEIYNWQEQERVLLKVYEELR